MRLGIRKKGEKGRKCFILRERMKVRDKVPLLLLLFLPFLLCHNNIRKGCNIDIIRLWKKETSEGKSTLLWIVVSMYKDIQGLCQAQVQVIDVVIVMFAVHLAIQKLGE